MNNLLKELQKEYDKVKRIENASKKLQQKYTYSTPTEIMASTKIRAINKRNTVQFYIKDENTNYYKYVPVGEQESAIRSINEMYYKHAHEHALKELDLIRKLQTYLENNSFDKIYDKLGKAKQQVITPIEIPEKQLIEKWLSEKYEGKPFGENDREIYTERGERVRSKSEKIIADKLYHENILYHYEYPLQIPGWGIIYPDFTILDVPNRRKIIYEHFGMMDDPEYAANANSKLNKYAAAGYDIGVNLYITMETSDNPFDSRTLNGLLAMLNHSNPKPLSSVNL